MSPIKTKHHQQKGTKIKSKLVMNNPLPIFLKSFKIKLQIFLIFIDKTNRHRHKECHQFRCRRESSLFVSTHALTRM